MGDMSDIVKGEAESAESSLPQASPLLTFAVGVLVIVLGFLLIFGSMLAEHFK